MMHDSSTGTEVDSLIAQFRADLAAQQFGRTVQEPGLSIDELVRRVDSELGVAGEASIPLASHSLSKWTPAQPELPTRQAYSLHELLQFDDAHFIETSYRVLLHRMPDPSGREFYLERLRRGEMSRVGVLAALRWSPEGVSRGIHVDGLLLPHLLERWQRWPVLGPVIGWLRGLLRLHTLSTRLESARQSQAREWQSLGVAHNALVAQVENRLAALQSDAKQQHSELAAQTRKHLKELADNATCSFDALRSSSESLQREIRRIAEELEQLREQLRTASEASAEEIGRLRVVSETKAINIERLERAINASAASLSDLQGRAAEADKEARAKEARQHALDPMYSRFEDRFRGKQEDIRKRAEVYLDVVRQPGIGDADSPVIDLGSGRGEWLEVLRHAGLHAFGIDTNQTFAAHCRSRGLAVNEGDAIAALESLPDASAGAITSMHLVEHLPFEVLVEMIDQAHRVLKPGGVLILETPNPENVNVGSHWFYLDPTHLNPLPPDLLSWLVEDRGFAQVEVRRLMDHRDFAAPDLAPEDAPGAQQINQVLAGYRAGPDYAVVAWRR